MAIDYHQHENIQTRKVISGYGGVGSLLETRNGSILVSPFNDWPYFVYLKNGRFGPEHRIIDTRFKNRLKRYFTRLEELIRIPVNAIEKGQLADMGYNLIEARYFPQWFYCPGCHKLDWYDRWMANWQAKVSSEDKEKLFPPKCYHCYLQAQKTKGRKWTRLEQVRFVLTSPQGDMTDIPWDKWALLKDHQKQQKGNDAPDGEEATIRLDDVVVPVDLELEMKTLDRYSDLSGILIQGKYGQGKKCSTTLSGLFNLRVPKRALFPDATEDVQFKPVLRSSTSIYYPHILFSIYLPATDAPDENMISVIKKEVEKGRSPADIAESFRVFNQKEVPEALIRGLINSGFDLSHLQSVMTENEYRLEEYTYITRRDSICLKDELIFERVSEPLYPSSLFRSVYRMDKLKITSVQTSFTRQEPIDRDHYLQPDSTIAHTKQVIRKKYTSEGEGWGLQTRYLPAVENFGEGIFFDFDATLIQQWISSDPRIMARVNVLATNHRNADSLVNRNLHVSAELLLIHSFSHLIIKELEFLCGYPSTSLQERLYVDETQMRGVLIYTMAGSEGSYGGLISLCQSGKLSTILRSALLRARDCASDPICYHSSGQGVGNLNLSACYSCSLLPETSCELFNCFLDRRLLIDEHYGFFSSILS